MPGKNLTLRYLRKIDVNVTRGRIEMQRGFAELDEELHAHGEEIESLKASRADHERRIRRLERKGSR